MGFLVSITRVHGRQHPLIYWVISMRLIAPLVEKITDALVPVAPGGEQVLRGRKMVGDPGSVVGPGLIRAEIARVFKP